MRELLLAIDTSTRWASCALVDRDGRPLAADRSTPDGARPLAALVERVVDGRWNAVGGYGIGVGPGSFTGLRVGLSFLKGLAAGLPRPVVPVSSLAAWAQSLDDVGAGAGDRLVLVDARREQVWVGAYRPDACGVVAPLQADARVGRAQLRAWLAASRPGWAVGTATEAVADRTGWRTAPDVPSPAAVHLGRLAQRARAQGAGVPARDVAPNYLMLSAAEEKLPNAPKASGGR